jgi:preprotein translocase subunit SecA
MREEHGKVVAAGGLHIIGTERHESRRIDNQLRGRAGRQGDPGSSKFFLSLDDDLMRIFGSGRMQSWMSKLGVKEGEVIMHPWVTRSISSAQKRVEGRNFEVRKHLKEYDDVMNLQRGVVYGLRQRALRGEDLKAVILEQSEIYLEEAILKHTEGKGGPDSWNLEGLYGELMTSCGSTYRVTPEQLGGITQKTLYEGILADIAQRYEEKSLRLGDPTMRAFERSVMLMVIDNLWKDHLYEMDHLKGGVQYTAYGQKNPLFEYQRQGRKMFEEMMNTLAHEVIGYVFRLERVEAPQDRMGLSRAHLVHGEYDAFSEPRVEGVAAGPMGQPPAERQMITTREGSAPVQRQPVRATQAVGRNDPCPCGSGKKYKKCHGKDVA